MRFCSHICSNVSIYQCINLEHRCDRFAQCSEFIVGRSEKVGDVLVRIVRDAHQVAVLRVEKQGGHRFVGVVVVDVVPVDVVPDVPVRRDAVKCVLSCRVGDEEKGGKEPVCSAQILVPLCSFQPLAQRSSNQRSIDHSRVRHCTSGWEW